MKYKVGDIVKVKSDLTVGNNADDLYVTTIMTHYRGKSARITHACYGNACDEIYHIDIDTDQYYWSNDCFENEEENKDENNTNNDDIRCKYIIGYKKTEDDSVHTFEGYIDNFHPTSKSYFINDDGDILLLPYNLIEYIMPIRG